MKKNRLSPVPRLNETLKSMAAHFESVSGIACFAVDHEGNRLASNGAPDEPAEAPAGASPGCGFCRLANALEPTNSCDGLATHRYGIQQAKRFGGSFVYFCPASLVHWASPVTVDDRIVGALVAGSVLMNEPDDYFGEFANPSVKSGADGLETLRDQFSQIPYVAPSRVSSLAKVMSDMAFSLSQRLENNALWETHVEGQQARISEYIHQLKIDSATVKSLDYPVAKERTLLSLIAQGDYANANQILNELLGFVFFASGRDMSLIKARILELAVVMSRAALEGGASVDAILKLNNTFLSQVPKTASIEDLSVSLSAMLKRFAECVFTPRSTRHADLIQKAIQYLNAHYARPIDLSTVSAHLHMSAAHFSKVFKEETGHGFVHFLNQLRVERSKDLLRDHSIRLAGIAEMVGFDDQSYFTKVFRKHTGMSPGQYRRNRGQTPEADLEVHDESS
ncbi:MAG: helix-turn-helix domain-containing protein [Propionivibrio sp.]